MQLFRPLRLGALELPNRICMAALTRQRCTEPDGVAGDLHIEYYSLRSQAGFILTECTQISNRSLAFPGSAGIHSEAQTAGWKRVVDAVHSKGGRIIAQIWHCGRATHSSLQNGLIPWGPSPIAIRGLNRRAKLPHEAPHAMTKEDIKVVIEQFRQGAVNAKLAGFDGVELHGAHGYLVDQFLKENSNQRTDEYGGSIENRTRFCLEAIDALISVFGANRVSIKVSPISRMNDTYDSNVVGLYSYLFSELDKRQIQFIELKDDWEQPSNALDYGFISPKEQLADILIFREKTKTPIIINGGYTPERAEEGIKDNKFDAVTFGKLFISNPDLVHRVQHGLKLNNDWDFNTFYTAGPKGYIDYPLHE